MRRLPVRPGETIYLPGGTLHSFGPGTLVHEIEQTSDIQQHAMRPRMEDGSPIPDAEWHANLESLLDEWHPEPRPDFHPGLSIGVDHGVRRTILCAGPYFALERWTAGTRAPLRHTFCTARILTNAGAPVTVTSGPGRAPWTAPAPCSCRRPWARSASRARRTSCWATSPTWTGTSAGRC
jgi:mannose-6-phosphate isomerase